MGKHSPDMVGFLLASAPGTPEYTGVLGGIDRGLATGATVRVFADVDGVQAVMLRREGRFEEGAGPNARLAALIRVGVQVTACRVCACSRGLYRGHELAPGVRAGDLGDLSQLISEAEHMGATDPERAPRPSAGPSRSVVVSVSATDGVGARGSEGLRAALGLARGFERHRVRVVVRGKGVGWLHAGGERRPLLVQGIFAHLRAAHVPCLAEAEALPADSVVYEGVEVRPAATLDRLANEADVLLRY